MRVYLAATFHTLAELLKTGELGPGPAFAVTPALREWYVNDDIEELEYAALLDAARASLRLLHADPAAAPRRVVIAADVPDAAVSHRPGAERAAVAVSAPVPMRQVAAVHVDDPDAEAAVRAAVAALPAADRGDDDARFTVDEAEAHELGWYANQEIGPLLDLS